MEGWKLAATILNYGIIISYNCSYGNGHCTATLGRLPGYLVRYGVISIYAIAVTEPILSVIQCIYYQTADCGPTVVFFLPAVGRRCRGSLGHGDQ